MTERLKEIDEELYLAVREVLDKNLAERHIRGGMATKEKYMRENTLKNKQTEERFKE